MFKWTRSTKLNASVPAHHAPYYSKYRYWTGLLLLVRVVLYITTSVTMSSNFTVSDNFLSQWSLSCQGSDRSEDLYAKSIVNVSEIGVYINLLALSAFIVGTISKLVS